MIAGGWHWGHRRSTGGQAVSAIHMKTLILFICEAGYHWLCQCRVASGVETTIGGRLSFLEISTKYRELAVRSKVVQPDRTEGNVADIRLFPNAAHLARSVEKRSANSKPKIELILEKLHVFDVFPYSLQEQVKRLESEIKNHARPSL